MQITMLHSHINNRACTNFERQLLLYSCNNSKCKSQTTNAHTKWMCEMTFSRETKWMTSSSKYTYWVNPKNQSSPSDFVRRYLMAKQSLLGYKVQHQKVLFEFSRQK